MTDEENAGHPLDNLDDLIRYYEAELLRLKQIIKVAVDDWGFSEAKSAAKEFRYVESRLSLLRNLKDPRYDQRVWLYDSLIRAESGKRRYPDADILTTFYQRGIDEANRELDALESIKYKPLDTQYIDDALFDLVNGVIGGFKVNLNKSKGMMIDFKVVGHSLVMQFCYNKGTLHKIKKKKLLNAGFAKTDVKRTLTRTIDVMNFRDALPIKQFLAIMLFEILGRDSYDRPAELEILTNGEAGAGYVAQAQ